MREIVKEIFKRNSFNHDWSRPIVVVFRNTRVLKTGAVEYVQDKGNNCCDLVLLVDPENLHVMQGRSLPHKKYVKKAIKRGGKGANYIVTSYNKDVWQKGSHRGFSALRQRTNKKFMVGRTLDELLMDEDDYNDYGIFYDNFHGWAPSSAGCVTVKGQMFRDGGSQDWRKAYNWIYSENKKQSYFSLAMLNYTDASRQNDRLRFGSTGIMVNNLQEKLTKKGIIIGIDGDFGKKTHLGIMKLQGKYGLKQDGIVGNATRYLLE